MVRDLTIVTHTHTDCKDLWDPYFDSYNKFFNHSNHIVLINQQRDEVEHKQVIYTDTDKYSSRLFNCLQNVKTTYILVDFEDMILYDTVEVDELSRIITVMDQHTELMYTRLIKSGITSVNYFDVNLFKMDDSDFLFSLTPTIWRTEKLFNVLAELQNLSIWDLEVQGSALLQTKNIQSLYYYNNSKARGGHYDSTIYPHICSAILKGKWNLSEYSQELLPIIQKYKIDINERGVC